MDALDNTTVDGCRIRVKILVGRETCGSGGHMMGMYILMLFFY